jgi:hypothetical protein
MALFMQRRTRGEASMTPFAYQLADPASPLKRSGHGWKSSANLHREEHRGPPSKKAGLFARLTSKQRP